MKCPACKAELIPYKKLRLETLMVEESQCFCCKIGFEKFAYSSGQSTSILI